MAFAGLNGRADRADVVAEMRGAGRGDPGQDMQLVAHDGRSLWLSGATGFEP